MDAETRREHIAAVLRESTQTVSATQLAKQWGVSRQVIVGDIALLRAKGLNVLATPRGYILFSRVENGEHTFTVACKHDAESTKKELYSIVDGGGRVIDVKVDHPVYGELSCSLNLVTHGDVDEFLQKVERQQASLLCDLTSGVHLHTIACADIEKESQIRHTLMGLDLLYAN